MVADAPGGRPRARVEPGARRNPAIRTLSIGLAEAVLGGRVEVKIGGDLLKVTIPPLSSGGRRLRLKGRGPSGADVFLELRIILPREIDEESRKLVERFSELNPYDPRED